MSDFSYLSALIDRWVVEDVGRLAELPTFADAAKLVVSSGAKRFRPTLTLLIADLLGVSRDALRSSCIALEYIHAASLVHDDLPALDNDDFRRGKPALHKIIGEGPAILVGDGLAAAGLQVVINDQALGSGQKIEILRLLVKANVDICEGQLMDLAAEVPNGRDLLSYVEETHRLKTGSLISSAAQIPIALLENPTSQIFSLYEGFGREIGLIFQITDDILDADDDDRWSYVAALGIEESRKIVVQSASKALDYLRPVSNKSQTLELFVRNLVQRIP